MSSPPVPVLPPPPQAPEPGDCCGGGCERCVLDVYQQRLQEWEELAAQLRAGAATTAGP